MVPDERHEQFFGLALRENIIKKSMIPVDEGVEEKDGPVSLEGKKVSIIDMLAGGGGRKLNQTPSFRAAGRAQAAVTFSEAASAA